MGGMSQQQRPLPPPPGSRPIPPPPNVFLPAPVQPTFVPWQPQPSFSPAPVHQMAHVHQAIVPMRPPTDTTQKNLFLLDQLAREQEQLRQLEAARLLQLQQAKAVQEVAFERQRRELEQLEAARRAAAQEAEQVARMRAEWESGAMQREKEAMERARQQETLNKAGLQRELVLANKKVAQLEASLEAELSRAAKEREKKQPSLSTGASQNVREEAAALLAAHTAYLGQLAASSVASAAEAARLRDITRAVVSLVKKSGTVEQKKALAATMSEAAASGDHLETAQSEWKTLPLAAALVRLTSEKKAALARWGVSDPPAPAVPEAPESSSPRARPVSPSRLAADFLPKVTEERKRGGTESKMTLSMTPQQSRIQQALDSQRQELMGKEEDKGPVKVKEFAQSYYG